MLRCEHLVQDHTKSEEVGTSIYILASDLLGRHVAGSADDDTADGVHRSGVDFLQGRLELRQAKIENLHDTVRPEEHILRLEVSVDDSTSVCSRETTQDSKGHCDGFVRSNGPGVHPLAQAL